ncbi:MAG: hypothetical protein AUK00_03540 [Dehalococcoidia bacterium CG2_30_46_9]|nr:MAG: hypothetical protein AUK00_03540 [Dehalococcoidia bacterium CG2_30_46_9]PIX26929.1 MAG: hypothetical protein COZ67_05000 [Chloroflexi bacterium CG_4_8_14_3_um_filter_45_15]
MVMIEKISNGTPYASICREPYSLSIFERKINGDLAIIEMDNIQKLILFNKRFLDLEGRDKSSGYCLVQCIEGVCNIDSVEEFRRKLDEITRKYANGNYMDIDPILIAKAFSQDVLVFIDSYNSLQKRKPVRLYTFG